MATDTQPTTARFPALIFIDGAKLRELRQINGMNQMQLGKATGFTGSYIGHLERGTRRSCSPSAFVLLCRVLHVRDRMVLIDTSAPCGESK